MTAAEAAVAGGGGRCALLRNAGFFFGRTDDVLKNDKTSSVWVYDKQHKYESLQRLSDLHHRLQSRDKQPIEISFLKECLEPCWPIVFLVAALSVTDS